MAPGTVGSLLGIPIFFLANRFSVWAQCVVFVLFCLLAIGTADWTSRIVREEDPSIVVIDEVVGMWATLLFLWRDDWVVILIGFLLFRAFDILKFFPLSLFETFRGGVGIVLDDVAAGMFANICLRVILLTGLL
ncbi:phosphatidylglycerophosphatase A [bacterium]|nr:phosphatidylglycerophosphatase A [bacterium]